jgi:hypothetical protein
MGITVQEESPDLTVLRITGLLKKSELDAVQAVAAAKWGPDTRVRLLMIVENFRGWDRDPNWGDLTFYAEHSEKIIKIAIVGDPKYETDFMMFTGAGFRPSPVKYFSPDQMEQARQWLV